MTAEPHCFRCRIIALQRDQHDDALEPFWSCPSCGASYWFENDGPLVDRWRMPVTLVVYKALLYAKPESLVEKAVLQLSIVLASRSPITRQRFLADLEAELAAPRQPLHKVLPDPLAHLPDREATLREFLRRVAEGLRSLPLPTEQLPAWTFSG